MLTWGGAEKCLTCFALWTDNFRKWVTHRTFSTHPWKSLFWKFSGIPLNLFMEEKKKSKNSINKRCPVIIWSSNLLSNLNSWYFLTPSQSLIHLHKFQIFQETKYRSQLPFFLGNNTERKSIYETLLEFSEIILCDSIILNILRQNTNSLNIFKKY